MATGDEKKEPSTPYGVPDEGGHPKPKDPKTGEPSAPYGEEAKEEFDDTSPSEEEPSEQPS